MGNCTYRCEWCDREFILDDQPIVPWTPRNKDMIVKVPYCPYCGRKSWPDNEPSVILVREDA